MVMWASHLDHQEPLQKSHPTTKAKANPVEKNLGDVAWVDWLLRQERLTLSGSTVMC
jgi:hypothetical protein